MNHGEGVVNPPGMHDAPYDSRKGSSGRTCVARHCPVGTELGTHCVFSHQYWTSLLYDRAGSRDSVYTKRRRGGGSLRRRREGGREGEKERWRSGSVQVILFGVGDRVRTEEGVSGLDSRAVQTWV